MRDIVVNAIGNDTTSAQGVPDPGALDSLPQSASEFILTALKFKVPIIDQDELLVLENLGSGGSMNVKKVSYRGQLVAMKTLAVDRRGTPQEQLLVLSSLTREVRFLSYTKIRKHPNIIRLLGISWTIDPALEHHGAAYALQPNAILELADRTLEGYVNLFRNAIPVATKLRLVAEMINGLDALHSQGLVHGDIKPANMLIKTDQATGRPVAKLGDFGESLQTYYRDSDDLGYSKAWKSPEMHQTSAPGPPQERQSSNLTLHSSVADVLDPGPRLGSATSAPHLDGDVSGAGREDTRSEMSTLNQVNRAIDSVPRLQPLQAFLALDQDKARDIFSIGLVAMYVLIEDLPFEDQKDHGKPYEQKAKLWLLWTDTDWLNWKLGVRDEAMSWIADHFSLPFQDAGEQIETSLDVDVDRLFGCVPQHMLLADPKARITSKELAEKFSCVLEQTKTQDVTSAAPLMDDWKLEEEFEFRQIPLHMREPLWRSLIVDADQPSGSVPLRTFIGMCYIQGDGVRRHEDSGLTWLLRAANEETSSDYLLAGARETCLIEYKFAKRPIIKDISAATVTSWVLDGVFLLATGYWYCRDQPIHQSKLKAARQSFSDVLENMSENKIEAIIGLGFAAYMAGRPSNHDSETRQKNGIQLELDSDDATNIVRSAVFSADNRLVDRLRADENIPRNLFWDGRLVRGIAHFGYEDSMRLLHRIDMEHRATALLEGRAIGSELLGSINDNNSLVMGYQPERLSPPLHGAVAKNRISCLAEILRLNLQIGEEVMERVDLNMTFNVSPLHGPETPLQVAVRTLRPYLVCLLLSYGADPNHRHPWTGQTVLHTICQIDVGEEDVHEWASGSYLEVDGFTVEKGVEDMKLAQRVILQLLLNCEDTDLQALDWASHTPLRICALRDFMYAAEALIERGASLSEEEITEAIMMCGDVED